MASQQEAIIAPWHAKNPALKHQPGSLTREQLLESMRQVGGVVGADFVLVDLRCNGYEGLTIPGSINLHARSLYPSIPMLYDMFKARGLRKIIWYCCSSRGCSPQAAGWFSGYMPDYGDNEMESVVLQGGIKGWVTAGDEFVEWMDEYEPGFWPAK